MSAELAEIPAWELEAELLVRAIARTETKICAHELALAHMRAKQISRQRELARQLAKGGR
jgi:hypothetical protein